MPETTPAPSQELIKLVAAAVAQIAEGIASPVLPEALDAREAAAFCGVARASWYDLDARGLCPAAVSIGDGKIRRWLRSELILWLRAGAPTRDRWNQTRALAMKRAS